MAVPKHIHMTSEMRNRFTSLTMVEYRAFVRIDFLFCIAVCQEDPDILTVLFPFVFIGMIRMIQYGKDDIIRRII